MQTDGSRTLCPHAPNKAKQVEMPKLPFFFHLEIRRKKERKKERKEEKKRKEKRKRKKRNLGTQCKTGVERRDRSHRM